MSTSALILPVGNASAAAAANGSGGSVDSTDALAATGYINGEMVSKTLAAAAAVAAKREEEEKDKANGNGAGRYCTDAVSDFDSDSDNDASGLKDYTADIYELRPGHQGNATATPAAATVGERSANHGEIRRSEADRRLKLATPNRYRFLVRIKRKSPSFDGLSFIVSYSLDGLTRPQHVLITQPTRGTQPLRHLTQQRRHLLPPSPVFVFPSFFSFFLGLGCLY